MSKVEFGWLIRSIHAWAATYLYIGFIICSVYFLKSRNRRPRELTWVTGVFLFFMTLAFDSADIITGNKLAFFATKVGTDIAGNVPIVGQMMKGFFARGDDVTGANFIKFFWISCWLYFQEFHNPFGDSFDNGSATGDE